MATSITCCLNSPPPTAAHPAIPKQSLASWPVQGTEQSWRRRCVAAAAAACVVLGTAVGDVGAVPAVEEGNHGAQIAVAAARWSDRRMCPPWSGNTLESIVPENLPRPLPRKRAEIVGGGGREVGRAVPAGRPAVVLRYHSGCFSL